MCNYRKRFGVLAIALAANISAPLAAVDQIPYKNQTIQQHTDHERHRKGRKKSVREVIPATPKQSTATRPVIVVPASSVQPWQITQQQEDILASKFAVLKSAMPKRFAITDLPSPSPESQGVEEGIHRAFARNGIDVPIETQLASHPTGTGIIFTMPDPNNPPEIALRLKEAFGLVGINGIQFVAMNSEAASRLDFTIFIGPAPTK